MPGQEQRRGLSPAVALPLRGGCLFDKDAGRLRADKEVGLEEQGQTASSISEHEQGFSFVTQEVVARADSEDPPVLSFLGFCLNEIGSDFHP